MFTGEFLSAVSCEGFLFWYQMCLAGLVVSMAFGLALCAVLCLCTCVGGGQSIPIPSCFNVHFLLKNGFVHCWEKNVIYSFFKSISVGFIN